MSAAVYAMAKKYYPKLWDKSRLDRLLAKKKLTQAEYDKLVVPAEASGDDNS